MNPGRLSRREQGFSALELLVIVVILCVVAAVGVPTLHARAKHSVLEMNLQSLASLVEEEITEGFNPRYRASGDGDAAKYLSNHLEVTLADVSAGEYVNPTVATPGRGRAVVNTSLPPSGSGDERPAVLITDAPRYQYVFFSTLEESIRAALAGSLVIAFDATRQSVDIFFVDAKGNRSSNVITVPAG
jgi:type II secretory pathway pseudopilin PulG